MICWRDVPTDNTKIGRVALKFEPHMRQVFVTGSAENSEELKRKVRFNEFYHLLCSEFRNDSRLIDEIL